MRTQSYKDQTLCVLTVLCGKKNMKKIKLKIAYEGTHYLGWQKTPEGKTIESELECSLEKIFQHKIELNAASRTDAGVHARGQIVHFTTVKSLRLNKLHVSLNQLLPKDIAVIEVEEVPLAFHATLDCKRKLYEYSITTGVYQLPEHRLFSWHYPHSLDLKEMKIAADELKGTLNFRSFCNHQKNRTYSSYERMIHHIEVSEGENYRVFIRIEGSKFLYKMARNIAGTLAYVGANKIRSSDIKCILESGNREKAGPTLPAHGLTLVSVFYH